MFTGIVEVLGRVETIDLGNDHARITLDVGPLDGIAVGDSIAVNGVCLTAVEVEPSGISLDVVSETLGRSSLGSLGVGDPVNLERARPVSGRLDGHIVQGHVDGVGIISAIAVDGANRVISIAAPADLSRYIVEKGSIAVDGISLTVADVRDDEFQVAVIPHTLSTTNLGLRKAGETVNLEVDILAKYIERLLEAGK
jgi:riboflavin synthase